MDTLHRPLLPALLFPLGALATLSPWVSPVGALLLGIALSLSVGNPWPRQAASWTRRTLAWSVAGLGAGMNLGAVLRAGSRGLLLTFCTILCTLGIGMACSRLLKVRGKMGFLVAAGTAICGGSAIAALAPAIDAHEEDTGIALVTVFVLNAVALALFPPVGRALGLDQYHFGLWSALAIHDTSSVVGAGLSYGPEALAVGTTVKLARALWIVPLTLCASAFVSRNGAPGRHPWFIVGFILMAAIFTGSPRLAPLGRLLTALAHKGMALSLFGIGAGISLQGLRRVGPRPLVLGLGLWLLVASASLGCIRLGWL